LHSFSSWSFTLPSTRSGKDSKYENSQEEHKRYETHLDVSGWADVGQAVLLASRLSSRLRALNSRPARKAGKDAGLQAGLLAPRRGSTHFPRPMPMAGQPPGFKVSARHARARPTPARPMREESHVYRFLIVLVASLAAHADTREGFHYPVLRD